VIKEVGLLKQSGGDIEEWPRVGCGAKFVPWAKGAVWCSSSILAASHILTNMHSQ